MRTHSSSLTRLLGALLAPMGCAVTTTELLANADAGLGQDVPADRVVADSPDVPPREDGPAFADITFADLPVDVPAPDAAACVFASPSAAAVCGESVCGNGRIDRCERCERCPGGGGGGPGGVDAGGPPPPFDAGTCCVTQSESCDGAELGGARCASLGYAGGTLGCGRGCGFDTSGCDACAPSRDGERCGVAAVGAVNPQDVALATLADRVGLAWIDGDQLGLAVLDAALRPIAVNRCAGIAGARRVALSASGQGFLLAVEDAAGVSLRTVDGRAALGVAGSAIVGATSPILAAGPDGGALLLYSGSGTAVSAARVSAAGAVSTQRAQLFGETTEAEYGAAVPVDDGWLVAMRTVGVEVVHVGLDLTVLSRNRPVGSGTEYPQLAWEGARATMSFSRFDGPGIAVEHVSLSRAGAALDAPQAFASPLSASRYYNVAPLARVGGATVALVGTHTGSTGRSGRIDLARVDFRAMGTTSPRAITASPEQVSRYRIAPLGEGVVVTWIGHGGTPRLGLARLTP